jgi:hypothetical protein
MVIVGGNIGKIAKTFDSPRDRNFKTSLEVLVEVRPIQFFSVAGIS